MDNREFLAAVRDLVAAQDASAARALVPTVVALCPAIHVPLRLRKTERGAYQVFPGETLRQRLAWIVGNAHSVVTSDLKTVAAAVGIDDDDNFLAYCYHAQQGIAPNPDRYLNKTQCVARGADEFRDEVVSLKRTRLDSQGRYPLGG
jgi:hypothetical protein